jgi:hypothetical protein
MTLSEVAPQSLFSLTFTDACRKAFAGPVPLDKYKPLYQVKFKYKFINSMFTLSITLRLLNKKNYN